MNDKFLITGATGFIGSCLTRFLVNKHADVNIIARNSNLSWRLIDIVSRLKIYKCDLLDRASLEKIVNKIKPSIIFHLASYGSLPQENNLNSLISNNIISTLNLIDSLKQNSFKLFINAGSSSEYGIKEKAMKESDYISPINDYGVCKATTTLFCQKIAITEKLPIITFRLFSPYGYYEHPTRLIPYVITCSFQQRPIKLSSPDYVRDFIFIEDVIGAFQSALHKKIGYGEIFNIGSGKQYTIKEVVDTVTLITKSKSEIIWEAKKKQYRQIEPKIWMADIRKAKKFLQFQPQFSLITGLQQTIDWFKKNLSYYA